MEPKIPIHMGFEVRKKLNEQNRSVNWLADELDCDRSNLNKKLLNPYVHPDLLMKISRAMNVDFFACYSKKLDEASKKG